MWQYIKKKIKDHILYYFHKDHTFFFLQKRLIIYNTISNERSFKQFYKQKKYSIYSTRQRH